MVIVARPPVKISQKTKAKVVTKEQQLLHRGGSKVEQDIGAELLAKMKESGCMDIRRAVTIRGEPINRDTPENMKSLLSPSSSDDDTKIIHFQRHGQGSHNLVYESWLKQKKLTEVDYNSPDPCQNPLVSEKTFDAPLTELGKEQCKARSTEASTLNPEIIIVSPLLRAIQSAELTWKAFKHPDSNGDDNDCVKNTGDIPWVAHEGCREEMGLMLCNKRRNLSEIQSLYPNIDFSNIQSEEDTQFRHDRRETDLEKSDRIYEFLQFIRKLPQKNITVVCHSAWLFHMCNAVLDIEDESYRTWFSTAEIRSMKLTFTDV